MFNNNGTLPARPDAMESGPYNLQLGIAPVAIQYQGPDFMQQFIPTIASCVALEIQSQVFPQPRNALRVFMFNLYSRNAFQNQQYAGLVKLIADLAAVEHMAGRLPDIQNSIPNMVVKVTEIEAGCQVAQYPGLTQYLDPSFEAVIKGCMAQMQQFVGAISNAQRGGQQQQQPAWGQATTQWNQNQGGSHWAAAGGYQAPAPQRTMVGVSSSGLFSSPAPVANTTAMPGPANRYQRSYSPGGETQEAVVQVETKQVVETTQVVSEPAQSTNLKWKASDRQPYPPAYNPRKADLFLSHDPETNTVTASFVEKESTMDYSRHQIPSVFGPLPSHYTNGAAINAQERIGRALKDVEDEIVERKADPEVPAVLVSDVVLNTGSLQELWTEGMVKRYRQYRREVLPAVYTYCGEVTLPFVSMRDEAESIKRLADSYTYAEVREKLLAMRATVMTGELWTHCERLMTKFVMETLKNNMSMSIKIDSFVEDYPDLVKLLKESRGDQMLQLFLTNEQKNIARLFKAPGENTQKDISEILLGDEPFPDDQTPVISFISKRYSLTLVNSTAFNLEVEFDPKVASGLTKTRTPELLKLATLLFDTTKNDPTISHHYVRTSDGRVLELTRGYIGDNFYLISLVD